MLLTGLLDDESNILTLNTTPTPIPAKTTWTVLLYLTSPGTGCQGGETVFYPDDLPGKKTPIKEEVVVELEVRFAPFLNSTLRSRIFCPFSNKLICHSLLG